LKPSTQVAAKKKDAKRARHKVAVKAKPAHQQAKTVAKPNPAASQPASTQTTIQGSGKTTTVAPPSTGTAAPKPGNKPSPAIAKGEEHP
jgi:hypothetical protein